MKNITIKSLREKQKDTAEITEDFFSKPKNRTGELEEEQYRPTKIKRAVNFIALSFFVLVVGGAGGVVIDRSVLPYLFVKYPELNQYEFLRSVNERTTVVEVIKEVKISEEKAAIEAIKKIRLSIVEVAEAVEGEEEPIYKNSGIILTSDGLIITALKSVNNEKKSVSVKLPNGEVYPAGLIYEDKLNELAIIKINQVNLPVAAFANSDNLELGEKLIILNGSVITDIVSKLIDNYIVPTGTEKENKDEDETVEQVVQKRIKIMNNLDDSFDKAPAINLKGEIVGLSQTKDLLIPINEVKKFMDEAM